MLSFFLSSVLFHSPIFICWQQYDIIKYSKYALLLYLIIDVEVQNCTPTLFRMLKDMLKFSMPQHRKSGLLSGQLPLRIAPLAPRCLGRDTNTQGRSTCTLLRGQYTSCDEWTCGNPLPHPALPPRNSTVWRGAVRVGYLYLFLAGRDHERAHSAAPMWTRAVLAVR